LQPVSYHSYRLPPIACRLRPPLATQVVSRNNRLMAGPFILIPGRTARQGCGISEGKFGANYQEEITVLQVAAEDMQRLGLASGDRVRLTSPYGQVEVPVIAAKGDELPAGLLFIPYGDVSSRLMGADTHGSGMPTSKGMDVELEVLRSTAQPDEAP